MGSECTRCPLHESARTVCIGGDGPSSARLLILGDMPLYEDDQTGKPFSYKSGMFLRGVLDELGLLPMARLSLVVRCRTPDHREPNKDEVTACRSWLDEELAGLPAVEIVVPLGKLAQRAVGVKGQTLRIAGVRRDVEIGGRTFGVVPLAHPSYVMRNPGYATEWQSGWNVVRTFLSQEKTDVLERIGTVYLGQYPEGLR